MMLLDSLVVVSSLLAASYAYCPPPGALLPPPTLGPVNSAYSTPSNFSIPDSVFTSIPIKNVSFAIKGSIGDNAVFQYEYSAPGREVPQSLFKTKIRIGSVTKMLTALVLEMSSDKIALSDSITKFIPGLNNEYYKDVTIGALASHTSGLGRYGYVGDLALIGFNASILGLPKMNNTMPGCDPIPGGRICTPAEELAMFNNPAYAPDSPNSGPMYSNIGYNLIGLALEAVHGKPYDQIIQDLILTPAGMSQSTFVTPPNDGSALLPRFTGDAGWFTSKFGNFDPTGGLWSTPNEMLTLLQALLSNKFLSKAKTRDWFRPLAILPSLYQLVGAPWEIIRPNDIAVAFPRPVTIYTKPGGVTGYAAYAVLVPEYNIALTIHAAGGQSGPAVQAILPLAIKPLIVYADQLARAQAAHKYAGTYHLPGPGNATSSLTLTATDGPGLAITALTVNGVPILQTLAALQATPYDNFSARLYPTDPDSLGTAHEAFRMLLDQKTRDQGFAELYCASWNWGDPYRYLREPLDTFVFEVEGGKVVGVELQGWRVVLQKVN